MALVHDEGQDRWYFSKEELKKTPSVLSGIDVAKELSYRQQSANLIQDMGQRLSVSQLTINTAIVYMHRFYMFHSFNEMNRNVIAPCCLFLSAKLEEQPRKLEHVIRVAHACLHNHEEPLDPKSEQYLQQAQDLVINESVLLQTLGFELTVDHPHTHVVRITQLVRASKDLAQTSYFMATNSLHLTSFCIQHKPSVVACVCIHLACKWSNWEFPRSSDNKDWWEYVDPTVTKKSLDTICQEFLNIIENCPSKLKRRINTVTIYKGGHRPKTSGETSSTSASAPNNGTEEGEPSSKSGDVENNIEIPDEQGCETNTIDAILTITSSAAIVQTATSKVTLPPLPPLTTKYANITSTSFSRPEVGHRPKSSSGATKDGGKMVSGSKHKLREHEDVSSPAKKLKAVHSSSSHGSHSKHGGHTVPGRPSAQPKHSSHQSSRSGSHHPSPKLPSKVSAPGQPHHSGHHGSVKRHTHSSSSHSATKLPSLHKHHSGSPLDAKKSSGDRHRRSSSSSTKPKAEAPPPSSSLQSTSTPLPQTRINYSDQTKKETTTAPKHSDASFVSPPGPQRFPGNVAPRLPPLPPTHSAVSKHSSYPQPPLPTDGLAAPPPPPPPNLPPPPPT